MKMITKEQRSQYLHDGFLFPNRVLTPQEAAEIGRAHV